MSAFKFTTGAAALGSAAMVMTFELGRPQGTPQSVATRFKIAGKPMPWPSPAITLPHRPHQDRRRLNPIRRADDMPN
jgi:hypothetical protein